jgi:hypothetical protein
MIIIQSENVENKYGNLEDGELTPAHRCQIDADKQKVQLKGAFAIRNQLLKEALQKKYESKKAAQVV